MGDKGLLIEIKGSSKEFLEALDSVKDGASSLENQLKVLGTISGAAFAVSSVEIGLATESYGKQEIAVNGLSQAMQAQGIFSADLRDQYVETAEALEKKTGIDSEAIITNQAMLQSMVGQIPITKELTEGVVNLAARTGLDLRTAFQQVGEAINGRTRSMQQYGIQLDANAPRSAILASLTNQLGVQFAGAAESQVKGLGSIKLLHSAYDDLQKKIGEEFAPVISEGIQLFAKLFNTIGDNKELVDLIVAVTAAGAAIGALGITLAAGGLAFIKLQEALETAKIAMSAMQVVTTGLVGATGIGLLVILATEIYTHWSSIWPAMQATYKTFTDNVGALASSLGKILIGAFTFDGTKFKEGLDQLRATYAKGLEDFNTTQTQALATREIASTQHEEKQSAILKSASDQQEAIKRDAEARKLATLKASNQLLEMEAEKASDASIKLKKEEIGILTKLEDDKYKSLRSVLTAKLKEVQKDEKDQSNLEIQQKTTLNNQLLANDRNYQALSAADKQKFDNDNQAELLSSIQTAQTTKEAQIKQELDDQIKANNQYLANQQKFGTAYATMNRVMDEQITTERQTALNDLAQMQNSHNETLKEIGKAAAIANITIQTAQAAMNIYEGFSTIPIIGPALGVAGAAAAVAYGAEQISDVMAAADGGLVTGGIPGRDSVPAMLMPGELVVPEKNFDDVVNSYVANHNGRATGNGNHFQQSGSQQPASAHLEISLKDNLMDFIEIKLVERTRMGISLQGATS